ncbi:MAG: hypothetical protein Q9170_005999, partial [Blastenia crenularia]
MHVAPDPRIYSSGRWLRWDKLERESRYIEFNFAALCKRAVELCPGAMSIASYEKKEGGYNKVFIFTMDNASRVVARLPTRISGPPKLTTNSEVATIKYCELRVLCLVITQLLIFVIPIPKILEWSDDSTNAIGSEYIIMEHAKGVQLHQIWPAMSLEQQVACTGAIVENIKQMAALDFPAYGFDPAAYCSALIDVGVFRLPPTDASVNEKPSLHGAVAEHIRLLNFGRDVASALIEDPRIRKAAAPILLHHDLHKRNIYVLDEDPTTITSIIDWQSSSINPAFMHANDVPDFAARIPTPDEHYQSEDLSTGDNADLCNQAFIAGVKLLMPKLSATWELDDDVARFFEYCHRTYRDGPGILRQVLIDLANRWKELALA